MTTDRHSLRLAFVSPVPVRDNSDFVLLEQEPLDPYAGYLTRMGVYGFLHQELFEGGATATDCGWSDGQPISKEIYAYPSRPGLAYRFGLSRGTVGEMVIAIEDYTEALQCNLELAPKLKYPARSVSRYEWAGEAYDQDGEVLAKPAVTMHGAGITLAQKVYGTLLVTYQVEKHSRWVSIPPREEALENRYQAFAWSVWAGGTAALAIEVPSGADEERCNSSFGGGTGLTAIPGAPDGPVASSDETTTSNYCSGEVME